MAKDIAIAWIRDGVLIDRMPENAVAFALATLQYIPQNLSGSICIEDLINFGFEKSGVSAIDKMKLFNEERDGLINVTSGALDYTKLVLGVEESLEYFVGVKDLLRDLHKAGVRNYITSAIDQTILDNWIYTNQGGMISNYLTEILGTKDGFKKGKDHFDYIKNQGATRIFYVADATKEIETGNECGVIPIGFANVITPERVVEAYTVLRKMDFCCAIDLKEIDLAKLVLPSASKLESNIYRAGAKVVIGGNKYEIIGNLRKYFEKEGIA